MIVADLPRDELRHRLQEGSLRLRTGPVVACIRSSLDSVHEGVGLMYANHRVEDADGFADFHVSVAPVRGLRRWVRPQVEFRFDGRSPFTPAPLAHAFPLLEWGLNWSLSSHCQQYLILHAAVVERDGRAAILPAPPGSGKSTLCAALALRGWRLLSDELTLIDPARAEVVPLARPIGLKNRSIELLREFDAGAVIGPVVHDTSKGSIAQLRPSIGAVLRADECARPAWIVLPQYRANSDPALEALTRGSALMQLIENAFNYHIHGRRGFELLADVVLACRAYRFGYSRLDDAIAVFERLAAGHEAGA